MRTLGKLKLIAVSAALVLGMSSCLKNDKKFAIYASPAYILQEGNRYQLQIQVQGNEQIKSASASLNGKNYSFSAVEGSQNFLMQINAYSAPTLDTIKEGLCTVTAFNAEGNSAVSQLQFYGTDKKIGNVTLTKFSYSGADGKVTAEWNKVENAEIICGFRMFSCLSPIKRTPLQRQICLLLKTVNMKLQSELPIRQL